MAKEPSGPSTLKLRPGNPKLCAVVRAASVRATPAPPRRDTILSTRPRTVYAAVGAGISARLVIRADEVTPRFQPEEAVFSQIVRRRRCLRRQPPLTVRIHLAQRCYPRPGQCVAILIDHAPGDHR